MRRLTDHDIRLWRKVAVSVKPFPGRVAPAEPVEPSELKSGQSASAALHFTASAPSPQSRQGPQPELADVSNTRKIRRGQAPVDARLDLHGHTQDSAYDALVSFVTRNRAHGARTLLVITGKGRAGGGVLRARLLDWIEGPEIRSMLAGYAQAHARHGGAGAWYLVLKSPRASEGKLDGPGRRR
jgi:DNA-nicking Smr family endonuclease